MPPVPRVRCTSARRVMSSRRRLRMPPTPKACSPRRASTDPRFISLVGQDAEFILGSKGYDARFPTGGNAKFVQAFSAKWSAPPGALAASAYAAGTVLAEALRRAGTADAVKLRSTLA